MRHLPPICLCLNWHHLCWSKILLHAFANTDSQNAVPEAQTPKITDQCTPPLLLNCSNTDISLLRTLLPPCACPSSSSKFHLTPLFPLPEPLSRLTLASLVNPFESHIMSNMQLRSNQQLPDSITSITLRKTSTDWRYCVPKWPCCASPIVLLICSCFSPRCLKIWMNEGRPHLPDQLLRSCQPNHSHISSTFLAVTES